MGSQASQESSVKNLVEFFGQMDIFPAESSTKRKMTKDTFWDKVQRPKKVGSKRTKLKEEVSLTESQIQFRALICKTDGQRKDFAEFESDSEIDSKGDMSMVSSCAGSKETINNDEVEDEDGPADEENWEYLKEDERPEKSKQH